MQRKKKLINKVSKKIVRSLASKRARKLNSEYVRKYATKVAGTSQKLCKKSSGLLASSNAKCCKGAYKKLFKSCSRN